MFRLGRAAPEVSARRNIAADVQAGEVAARRRPLIGAHPDPGGGRGDVTTGRLAPELAAGIARVRSAEYRRQVRNWLSLRLAQVLLNGRDIATTKGLRDRAIIAPCSLAAGGDGPR